MPESFSSRYGENENGNLTFDDAPQQVRVGLREVLHDCGYDSPTHQRAVICRALRILPDENNWTEYPNVDFEINQILHGLPWYKFYDLCEKLAHIIRGGFEDKLNMLFREERVGYKIENEKIDKVGTEEFNETVVRALERQDNKFDIPLRQLSRALAFRNSLPPDYPNAVKEAVNSVEGVLQIAANMPGTAMPSIISSLNPQLPSSLKKVFDGLYGYGSGSQGARHSSVGGHVPSTDEAEMIIHVCAATVTYIRIKYGR